MCCAERSYVCFVRVSGIYVIVHVLVTLGYCACFFFQAEDGIRDLVRSRGLGDVYKRQLFNLRYSPPRPRSNRALFDPMKAPSPGSRPSGHCLSLIHI